MKKYLFLVIVLGMAGCQQRYADTIETVQKSQVEFALNIPAIALKLRPEVESIVGKPLRYEKRASKGQFGDEATYAWGTIAYNKGRVVFVIVKFPLNPANYQQAFSMVGFPSPAAPFRRNDGTLIWSDHQWSNGMHCCSGLAFHDIFIDGAMSEIHVEILDLDDPSGWSSSERQVLKTRTGKVF